MPPTLPPDYFERLYADADDPWHISSGWYEERKRSLVLASLPRERFGVIFEPGCSNGELSVELARRCTRLVSWDVVPAAARRARERTAASGNVDVRDGGLPSFWPAGTAELVVLSEVGYYLDAPDLERAVKACVKHLEPDGILIAVHWRHPAAGYPLTGDRVHKIIDSHADLHTLARYQDEDLNLDVWTVGTTESVARRAGVV